MEKKEKPVFTNPEMNKELEKTEQEFQKFDQDVKAMTQDRMNEATKADSEPQTKISTREAQKDK